MKYQREKKWFFAEDYKSCIKVVFILNNRNNRNGIFLISFNEKYKA